jgi:FKBP12-rapamycin complex-associated protein
MRAPQIHSADIAKLYGEIDVQLNQWRLPGSKLYLATSAPRLLSLRDCILTVPGELNVDGELSNPNYICV